LKQRGLSFRFLRKICAALSFFFSKLCVLCAVAAHLPRCLPSLRSGLSLRSASLQALPCLSRLFNFPSPLSLFVIFRDFSWPKKFSLSHPVHPACRAVALAKVGSSCHKFSLSLICAFPRTSSVGIFLLLRLKD
jgi:hypothetical protein